MKYALDFHSFARVFWMIFFFKKKKILTSALYNLLLNCFKSYPILNSFGCILLDFPASYLVASQPLPPFGKYWMRELEATKKKDFPAPSQSLHYPRRAASNTYTCILGIRWGDCLMEDCAQTSGRFCIMRQTTRRNLPGSLSHGRLCSTAKSFGRFCCKLAEDFHAKSSGGGITQRGSLISHCRKEKDAGGFLGCRKKKQFMTALEKSGAEGFEPTNGGVKNRCLATWRRPI
jgi:hypothetical protein